MVKCLQCLLLQLFCSLLPSRSIAPPPDTTTPPWPDICLSKFGCQATNYKFHTCTVHVHTAYCMYRKWWHNTVHCTHLIHRLCAVGTCSQVKLPKHLYMQQLVRLIQGGTSARKLLHHTLKWAPSYTVFQ